MKKSSYEIMKSAVDKQYTPTIEEINSINPFFMLRYVSNDPNSIYIANALNCMSNVPIEAQYNFVRNSTLDKVSYVNFPKKEEEDSIMLETFMKHFNVNKNIAKEYSSIMNKEETEKILNMYNHGVVKN